MAQPEFFFSQNVHLFTMFFFSVWLANTLLVEQGNWVPPHSLILEMAEISANPFARDILLVLVIHGLREVPFMGIWQGRGIKK